MPRLEVASKQQVVTVKKAAKTPPRKATATAPTKQDEAEGTLVVTAKKPERNKRKRVVESVDSSDDGVEQRVPRKIKAEKRECQICAEEKKRTEYNFPSIESCNHTATVCKDCLKKHFQARIEANLTVGWGACTCPSCAQPIQQKDARAATTKTFQREMDKNIDRKAELSNKNFIWCPHEGCGYGEVHKLNTGPWVKCKKCKKKICFKHQRKWHDGMTCQEFDEAGDVKASAGKNEAELRRMTKPCPFCKTRIQKQGGCNHMVCSSCSKQWWWNGIAFDGETVGTSAEFAGGPELVAPLQGQALANVNAAMEAANRASQFRTGAHLPEDVVDDRMHWEFTLGPLLERLPQRGRAREQAEAENALNGGVQVDRQGVNSGLDPTNNRVRSREGRLRRTRRSSEDGSRQGRALVAPAQPEPTIVDGDNGNGTWATEGARQRVVIDLTGIPDDE